MWKTVGAFRMHLRQVRWTKILEYEVTVYDGKNVHWHQRFKTYQQGAEAFMEREKLAVIETAKRALGV